MSDEQVVAAAPEVAPVVPASEVAPTEGEIKTTQAPRTYTQEEMDIITAKVKKNERKRTRKEVEAYYQGRESITPPGAPTAPRPEPVTAEPTRDQYESNEAFLEARAEFVGRRAVREALTKEREAVTEREAMEAAAKVQTAFREKTLEKFPEINERLEEIGDLPIYRGVQAAISESEFGPEIFNDLVSKPTEFERLMKMSETAAIREIGRLEAKFEVSQKPVPSEVKKPSNAPAPIKPIIGKAVTGDEEPSHDKPDEWRKWRDRQVLKRKTGT